MQEALTEKFDFDAMESGHVQRYVQLQQQYDECRCCRQLLRRCCLFAAADALHLQAGS
jgi:hypothetical protein